MFAAASECTYLAGWMAADDMCSALAQRYYIQAIRLADEAGDPLARARVLRGLSLQALELGHASEALAVADAALDAIRGGCPAVGARQVNRIIVVTRHGTDACDTDAAYVENEIRERIGSAHLGIEFRLVGYDVPQSQRDTLEHIATGAKAPAPAYADSPAQLNATLNWFANVEPVLRNAKKIVDILNPAVDQVNGAVNAIEDDRLDIANRDLSRARGAINDTDTAFEDLQGRTKTPAERDIDARAARLRLLQRRVVTAADAVLTAARSGAPQEPKLEIFREVATAYNTEVNGMNHALARLRATFPVTS